MQRNLIYLLYRLLQAIVFPLLVVYLLLRGIRDRRYFGRLWERLGVLPHSFQGTASGAIWLHAVSVGEVISSVRLLRRLRADYPSRRIFVSSTTLAGRALAAEKLAEIVDGVFYAPVDYCFAVRRVLRRLQPSIVIVLETEIWPNWYREVKRTGAGLLVVNGRISDKAIPSYRRYRWFFQAVLSWPDRILAQSQVAASRYLELGAPADRVIDSGNLKYDFDPHGVEAPAVVRDLIEASSPGKVWIAASTMPPAHSGDVDEDDVVIDAYRALFKQHPDLLLILVPRRPNRFDSAAEKLAAAGLRHLRRSALSGGEKLELPGVLLLDSIGELGSVFPLADLVFMGGTLAERGGHNILEPAFFGKPIVIGPRMENFSAIAEAFRAAGAVVPVSGPVELGSVVNDLLIDPARAEAIGQRGRELARASSGATERAVTEIRRASLTALATDVRPRLLRWLLWPLSRMWGLGTRLKRSRAMARQRRLQTPVVSVGGIGMGGAGKTPFTLHLAQRLRADGMSPAILTRGYRRRVPEKSTILEAGSSAGTTRTGDEAQLFLRSGVAHLGIGADRFATGTKLEKSLSPDIILLDDGFQHWRLGRDLDIVLIDALDPFGGDALFPLGWLREELDALRRADAFVVTRLESGSPLVAIENRLAEINPDAPVFRSRVEPLRWVDVKSGETAAPETIRTRQAGAFCGLANPASFWRSLAGLGCHPVACWRFGDHHHYSPRSIKRMAAHGKAAGADVLVTTEKDLMNVPRDSAAIADPLDIWWLEIGIAIEREEELIDLIRQSS